MDRGWEEFNCIGCGAYVLRYSKDEDQRCITCRFFPGWTKDAKLRKIFAPEWEDKD
jgi:hypothetical protein